MTNNSKNRYFRISIPKLKALGYLFFSRIRSLAPRQTKIFHAFSTELRRQEKITKQDLKDIVSWGGTRNDAAHGQWENVEDRNRIKLMLEGVNLFMRKYSE